MAARVLQEGNAYALLACSRGSLLICEAVKQFVAEVPSVEETAEPFRVSFRAALLCVCEASPKDSAVSFRAAVNKRAIKLTTKPQRFELIPNLR